MKTAIENKICTRCKTVKPVSDFYKNSRSSTNFKTQTYRAWCKECINEQNRNTPRTKERRKATYKRHYNSRQKWLRELKSNPCTDCGQTFDPVCMHFDHLPGFKKLHNISIVIYQNKQATIDELKKCELVCANCHAIRTKERREHE